MKKTKTKTKTKRKRQDVYLDNELWEKFGKWVEGTSISRSRWVELLLREFNRGDPDTLFERITELARTLKK